MTSKTPWFPLYIADYQADTMHLTRDQHGAYFLLMLAYYRRGKALPDDDGYLAGVTKSTAAEWRKLRPIIAEFFAVDAGQWRHKRIEAELIAQNSRGEERSRSGSAGARARWHNPTKPTTDAIAELLAQPMTEPMHSSHTQSQEEPPPLSPPVNGRGKKRLSPIEGIAKGFADALAERARDRRPDHPADGPLLDGAGAGSVTPLDSRRLA